MLESHYPLLTNARTFSYQVKINVITQPLSGINCFRISKILTI